MKHSKKCPFKLKFRCICFLNLFFVVVVGHFWTHFLINKIKTPEIYKEFLISIANIFLIGFFNGRKRVGGTDQMIKSWNFFHYLEKTKLTFFSQHPIKAYEHLLQCDIMYSFAIFIIWLIRQWLKFFLEVTCEIRLVLDGFGSK